jgi:hypothetical protein
MSKAARSQSRPIQALTPSRPHALTPSRPHARKPMEREVKGPRRSRGAGDDRLPPAVQKDGRAWFPHR